MMDTLYKTYLYKNLFQDVSKFVRKNLKDIDFDKEYWLHKAGLSSYTPVKSSFGGISLLLLGAIAGAGIALVLAPKPGAELRTDVKDRALKLLDKANERMSNVAAESMPVRA